MDRKRQTLELLELLGDEVTAAVLGRLQPERAETLRARMMADRPHISTISRQREVLNEFECFLQFALKGMPIEAPSSIVDQPNTEESSTGERAAASPDDEESDASDSGNSHGTTSDTDDEINETSESELGESSHESPTGNIDQDAEETDADKETSMTAAQSVPVIPSSADPLRDLQTLSVHQVAQALASEQSRTTAILLSKLPAKMTGEILSLLKPEYQSLVMKELSKEQHAPAVLVERIARATFTRAQQLPSEPPDTRDHADRVAEVLRSVAKAGRRNMLAAIEEQDPDLAKSLLTRIYRFDDIATLSKSVVQRVLGEVDSTNLTTALFGAAETVKESIFANLSKRARQTIEEEMQFMTNVSESRIQQARNAIAEIIAKIDMESES